MPVVLGRVERVLVFARLGTVLAPQMRVRILSNIGVSVLCVGCHLLASTWDERRVSRVAWMRGRGHGREA
jgi:hypothetical protein